jgi:hypothetical protein
MSLRLLGHIDLPENLKPGGFDHAAVHCGSGRLYVAHTANDVVDVIDCVHDRYLHSIENLAGVAGALVADEQNLVFTSNRGENTVGIFPPDNEAGLTKLRVGIRPNGLAYDPGKDLLLVANVGDPEIRDSFTLSMVNVKEQRMTASVRVPGRTRWTVFDAQAELFTSISLPPRKSSWWLPVRRIGWRVPSSFPLLDHMGLILTRNTGACSAPVTASSW